MPPKRWIGPPDSAAEAGRLLAAALGLPLPLASVLANRGIHDPSAARAFLRPRFDQLHDPLLLPGMPAAVDRVNRAIDDAETILVHGDFDADGMCSAALLTLGLRRLGADATAFVPHRTRDGYDFGPAGLQTARARSATLVITADCGITAVETVERATESVIDVIVTDHHRPGSVLPAATALVNPLLPPRTYPFDGLAGVGVAFKLLAALFARAGLALEELNQHLDLVAVGTVADRMPLLEENRVLVRAGLRALARTRKPGLRALLDLCEIEGHPDVSAEDVAFRIAPRLNSSGRVGEAEAGLRLLLATSETEAQELAERLEGLNSERVSADRSVTQEVEEQLESRFQPDRDGAVVVWSDGWHPGVVGIVASRIVEKWDRPAIVVAFDGETGRGSARSVDGFHLVEALRECAPLLERFGGHHMAAGLTILRPNIEVFADRMRSLASERLKDRAPSVDQSIDLEIEISDATDELYDSLRSLRPFGSGNPRPVLAVRGVRLERIESVGNAGTHLRAEVRGSNGSRLPVIGFGFGDSVARDDTGVTCDLAFHLTGETWKGRRRLQARLLDLVVTGAD